MLEAFLEHTNKSEFFITSDIHQYHPAEVFQLLSWNQFIHTPSKGLLVDFTAFSGNSALYKNGAN